MSSKIHLVMPMGGAGSRFFKNGFIIPKPLIELNGKPFFYWATQSIVKFVDVEDITFVVLKKHIEEFEIDKKILEYYNDYGANSIDDDLPIIFNDCDHAFISEEFNNFCADKKFDLYDGALLTFESNDPKYSFLRTDKDNNVIETVEKKAISNHAICGAYYFKNKDVFTKYKDLYLNRCNYSEYYVSGVYNIMAEDDNKIHNFKCDIHIPFGTPEEYYEAENKKIFKKFS